MEEIGEKFKEDMASFTLFKKDKLLLEDVVIDFNNYFNDKDRCEAKYQAKLYFNWLLTLSKIMIPMEFIDILENEKTKLRLWSESAFRHWGGYEGWCQNLTELLDDMPKLDKLILSSIKKLSIGNIKDFE